MMTRKMFMLAIMLIVLIAGVTIPVMADQNDNKGQAKKTDSQQESDKSGSQGKKDDTGSPVTTPLPIILTTAAPTISPVPAVYAPGQKDKQDKLKIGNIHKPDKAGADATVTTGASAMASAAPGNNANVLAEKNQADKKIKVTLNQIDLYVKWVQNSRLPESEKAALIAEANENRDWYLQMGTSIQAATDAGDLRGKVARVNQYNELLKTDLKKNAGLLATDEVDGKIATARNVSALAGQKIAAAKANGKDTAEMERLLSDYNIYVNTAAGHTDAAKAHFTSITSATGSDKLFNDGYLELQQAESHLTQAYGDLKGIYRLLFNGQ